MLDLKKLGEYKKNLEIQQKQAEQNWAKVLGAMEFNENLIKELKDSTVTEKSNNQSKVVKETK